MGGKQPRVPTGDPKGGQWTSSGPISSRGDWMVAATEPLISSVKDYSLDYDKAKNIAEASKGVISGKTPESKVEKQAARIVKEIANSKPVDRTMYRGVGLEDSSVIRSLNPGDSLLLDRISSFSTMKKAADSYASRYGGDSVLFTVKGKNKGLATDPITGLTHQEVLTHGKFKVTKISKDKVSMGGHLAHFNYDFAVELEQEL